MMQIEISPMYNGDSRVESQVRNMVDSFECTGETLYAKRNIVKSLPCSLSGLPSRWVVKRYKRLNILQQIIYTWFRVSKGKRAFHNAIRLSKLNIETPQEIACVHLYKGCLLLYSYYMCCYTDSRPIKDRMPDTGVFDYSLAVAFAHFVAELHEKGILHHDLNSTNVLYRQIDNTYHFSVIDINRMDFKTSADQLSPHDCMENLTRFTGRLDLFECVLKHYIACRGWSACWVEEALKVKIRHDKRWRYRKNLLKIFK